MEHLTLNKRDLCELLGLITPSGQARYTTLRERYFTDRTPAGDWHIEAPVVPGKRG